MHSNSPKSSSSHLILALKTVLGLSETRPAAQMLATNRPDRFRLGSSPERRRRPRSPHGSKEDRALRERQALDLVAVLRSGPSTWDSLGWAPEGQEYIEADSARAALERRG